jgi:hypothetical protein
VSLLVEAKLAQRRWDAVQKEPGAWDAWDDARRDGTEDAHRVRQSHYPPELAAGAEKSAGQERGVQARGDRAWGGSLRLELRAAQAVASFVPELCTPDAVQFVERSCAARAEPELQALA